MAKYDKTKMYFFKFPNTFFDTDEIDYLLGEPDGAETVILYLRLIVLATNKEGYLCKIIAGELKPYTEEELSRRTNTSIEDLRRRIKKLHDVGLIVLKDQMLFIEEALNYTNQTVGAEKKQQQRKKKKDKCPPESPQEIEDRNNIIEFRNNIKEEINNNLDGSSFEPRWQMEKENPALQDITNRVINYLNQKAFRNFKPETKKTIDLIKLRLSEGYTENDFYKVIDNKVIDWLSNKDYEEYLRPITLFGDSFEEYLNEIPCRNEKDWKSFYYDKYENSY